MKTKYKITIIMASLFLSASICISYNLFQNETSEMISKKRHSPLPLLAGICDIVGIGRVTNHWDNGKGVYIAVDNYWRGDPGHDFASVYTTTNLPPVSNDPLVFFITKHYGFVRGGNIGYSYNFIFDEKNIQTDLYLYEEGPQFDCDDRSWFPASDTNLFNFASNLVFAVESSNTNLFYETIRDGYRLHPDGSRIRQDSYFAFRYCDYMFTTNFMVEVMWWDPLLQGEPRGCLINNYWLETWIWLHEVLPRP